MQVIEETATHFRVRTPSGQELTIARTPGTEAMVRAQAPGSMPGMAGGGVMPTQPQMGDGVTLPELQPEYDPYGAVAGAGYSPAPLFENRPPLPAVTGGETPPEDTLLQKVAAPWQDPLTLPELTSPLILRRVAASAGAIAGDAGAKEKIAGAAKTATKAVKDQVVLPAEGDPETPAESAPVQQQPGPELDADLARLAEPDWTPGAQGLTTLDMSELNAALGGLAETQAAEQEELAKYYASLTLPEQPKDKPVDPGQFYQRVGEMFGAKDPRSARLIGGIATGLMAGIGEIGAALSHRQNVAAGMIQNAIAQNIASQQDAQALTRQQWLDQTAYATALSNRKISELGAKAKAAEIRAQVPVLIAKNNLAYIKARATDGSLTPAQAKPLIEIEESRAADAAFMSLVGTTPAGPGGAVKEKMGNAPIIGDVIGPNEAADYALGARDMANASFLRVLEPSDRPMPMKDAWAKYGNLLYAPGDYGETLQKKYQNRLRYLKSQGRIHNAASRGTDPKGAGTITPGARPN